MTAPATRVAFVGSAHVHTPDYLAVCRETEGVRIVGLALPDPDTRPELTGVPVVDSLEALAPHDLAVVLSDAAAQAEVVPRLKAPRLFVEKPLGASARQGRALAGHLGRTRQAVEIGFFLRRSPAMAALREALRSGMLGPPRAMRATFVHDGLGAGWLRAWPAHLDPARMGHGPFGDLAIHLVDAAAWLLGSLTPAACLRRRHAEGLDVAGGGLLRGPGGVLVLIEAGAVSERVALRIRLRCAAGLLGLDGGVAWMRRGGRRTVLWDGPMPTPAEGFRAALAEAGAGAGPSEAVAASALLESLLGTEDRA